MRERAIFHMDGDAFFVGVEIAKNSKLKGLPVVTGKERGIVTALSYEAKALGVYRGLPIFQLKKDFPNIIILPGDYASYVKYSRDMFNIVRRYVDDVEEYSIDECFADLTGLDKPLKMSYREIAELIKRKVNSEMALSVSLGVAPTKVLAKVASKWVKPDGLTVIEIANAQKFLQQVPINKIWGVGPQTSKFLMRKGIQTAGDFAGRSINWVGHYLSKPYIEIWKELNGVSIFKINPLAKTEYSSIQKTRTFYPPTEDKIFLFSQLSKHIEDACSKARYYKLAPRKVSIFLKTQSFCYARSEVRLLSATNSPEMILPIVRCQLDKIYKAGTSYRASGAGLHDLTSHSVIQRDLFGETVRAGKFDAIHEQIDDLEGKFGKHIVHLASTQSALKRKVMGTDSDDLDRDLLFL